MEHEIAAAIRNKSVIELEYPPGLRTVEPHAIGKSADNNGLLRVYQTGGASQSGEHEHWKLLRTDRISSLNVTEKTFAGPRPGYRHGDKAMRGGIIEEL